MHIAHQLIYHIPWYLSQISIDVALSCLSLTVGLDIYKGEVLWSQNTNIHFS